MILVTAITLTTVFYTIALYMSYISVLILVKGYNYKVAMPVIKSITFILICYTSIIADVHLFHAFLYQEVAVKNSVLLVLIVTSLVYARNQKGE